MFLYRFCQLFIFKNRLVVTLSKRPPPQKKKKRKKLVFKAIQNKKYFHCDSHEVDRQTQSTEYVKPGLLGCLEPAQGMIPKVLHFFEAKHKLPHFIYALPFWDGLNCWQDMLTLEHFVDCGACPSSNEP